MTRLLLRSIFIIFLLTFTAQLWAEEPDSAWTVNNYYKLERMIPMRDGKKLFTAIYIPKDSSFRHPILLNRTPYSCSPYGEKNFRALWIRNTKIYLKEKYILVFQDVRGRYMSEGEFMDVRPHIANKKPADTDESTDTYDAIDWLVKNVPGNNGCVGVSGISYPGFYATHTAMSGHPALKAVSPQAPVTDWFKGDDFHHNGAFFLMDCFNFYYSFGAPRPVPTTKDAPDFNFPIKDAYEFYLREGTLKNLTRKYMGDTMIFWNQVMKHPDYDEFWKARTPLPHLQKIQPAVLTVGGLFDAEDVWGSWSTYKAIEKQNPGMINKICMGPWYHGGWSRGDGSRLGNVYFGSKTSLYYTEQIELPFFNYYLKNKSQSTPAADPLPEAYIFFTGENQWRKFEQWPPVNIENKKLYLNEKSALRFTAPLLSSAFSEYVSDPQRPVPYTEDVHLDRTREYMTDDQRFASRRTDVLVFKTEPLTEPLTLAGPVIAELLASISTTDADFVVKLIDVFPDNFKYPDSLKMEYPMNGYQMLVRGEVIRGRYRNSLEKPEAFIPGKTAKIQLTMPDIAHTFQKGHRIMVQIQSSWFPLVDRNPQQFVNIYECEEKDFVKSTIRIYHDALNPSGLILPVLKP